MSGCRGGRGLALRASPPIEPVAGVVHVESRAPRAAPGRLPDRPRAAGLRRLHLLVLAGAGVALAAAVGCAADGEPPPSAASRNAAGGAHALADDFRLGFDAGDSASVALAAFLAASVAADASTDAQRAWATCGVGDEPVFPTELLAAYEITGRSSRGDTVVVRASVVTAAEQRADRRQPGRYVGTVRERRGEWEWDVVREADGWRVCAGPTFGLPAPDALTTWRPDGASAAAARALAGRIAARPAVTAPRRAAATGAQ